MRPSVSVCSIPYKHKPAAYTTDSTMTAVKRDAELKQWATHKIRYAISAFVFLSFVCVSISHLYGFV